MSWLLLPVLLPALGCLGNVVMVHALTQLRLAVHHREQYMHGRSNGVEPLEILEYQFVWLRLQLMKLAMGSFRGYISADGVMTSVTGLGDTCGHEATTDTRIGIIPEN